MEQNLARVIAIDKEDFASLNKLRLLRMCKVLCKSSAPLDMAVGIVSTTPIDDIMYGLFGFDRVRVSILDLMRPRTSIITMAQSRVYDLLEAWAPDETNLWFPPGTVGASFEDAGIRMRARAQVLQMSAGILDGFELVRSNPPYSLVVLSMGEPHVVASVMKHFWSIPEACLPLGVSRLKNRYVDSSRFTELAAPALEAWASSTFVSIDMSERSHNRMRNDLNTSGPGRSPTVSSNRVFCREVAAAHVAHGGDCIGSGKGMSLNPAAASGRMGIGGNPRLEFGNRKLQAFKALRAPARPLTKAEVIECRQKTTTEWALVEAHEREVWKTRHFAANLGRKAARAVVANTDKAKGDAAGWGVFWSLGLEQGEGRGGAHRGPRQTRFVGPRLSRG